MSSVGHRTSWRPIACTAVLDEVQRRQIGDELRSAGWTVVELPTGYHLVEHFSDAILGKQVWCRPSLVIADAISPGCSGLSIAQGLRDLGWNTPVVLLVESHSEISADAVAHREPRETGGNPSSPCTEPIEA